MAKDEVIQFVVDPWHGRKFHFEKAKCYLACLRRERLFRCASNFIVS